MKCKIVAVFKTHFDIGFTELAEEIIARYSGKMLDDAIAVCEATKERGPMRFVWTMSAWPLLVSLENAPREKRIRAEKLIARGQLAFHALPFTTHTEFLGMEELLLAFKPARVLSQRYGVPFPISAKMTDVPGHTRVLPAALAGAGVKFLHLGCNAASTPPRVPTLFWWEGPDGSRVLTQYNRGGYGSSLLPPRDWPFPVWLALVQTNDNIGPQGVSVLAELERAVAGTDCTLTVGTMDDFFREIERCDLTGLPVVKSDLADSWIHGVGSYPKEVSALRRNRERLSAYAKALCLAGKCGDIEMRHIDCAYEQALLFGEHTWGLDVKSTLGYGRYYPKAEFSAHRQDAIVLRLERSWEEQSLRAGKALSETQALLPPRPPQEPLLMFNPGAAPFTGYVETDPSSIGVPERLEAAGHTYAYLANAPALESFALRPAQPPRVWLNVMPETIQMESDVLRAEISRASGLCVRLLDKRTGKNWAGAIGGYRYDVAGSQDIAGYLRDYAYRYYDWAANDFGRMSYPVEFPHSTDLARPESVRPEGKGVVATFAPECADSVSEYGNAASVTLRYALLYDRLNVRVELNGKPATPYVEAGHILFDFGLSRPRYTVNKLGSLIDPARDVAEDANHAMYCLEHWVDVSDGRDGVAVLSYDAPLFSLGEQMLYRFRGRYVKAPGSRIYFNLFNNMWGTNFPQWTEGDYRYEFDLLPHAGPIASCAAALDALVSRPLPLPVEVQRGALRVENVKLESVSREGGRILLRLREGKGRPCTAKLSGSLLAGRAAYLGDLAGRRIAPLSGGRGGVVAIPMKRFEIATVFLEDTTC